jgi:hypothetical protein
MPRTSHSRWFDKSTDIWCVAPSEWDCGVESRRGHGSQFLVSVLGFQVGVSTLGWSLVRGSPTECGMPVSVIVKPRKVRPWPGMESQSHRKENKMIFGVDYNLWGPSLWNFLLASLTSCPLDPNAVVNPLFPTLSNYDFYINVKNQISHHYKNNYGKYWGQILNLNFHSKSKSNVNTVFNHNVQTGLIC